ncbi:hypothetical protein [Yinghuangia sp. YIM S09857]|uniref:hypothetical protein n=1 Tax=Yinghuangia sp. YIM S09857 TaxID=3436929 RepID=UPI003F53867E
MRGTRIRHLGRALAIVAVTMLPIACSPPPPIIEIPYSPTPSGGQEDRERIESRILDYPPGLLPEGQYAAVIGDDRSAAEYGIWVTGNPDAFADVDFSEESVVAMGPLPLGCVDARDIGLASDGDELFLTYTTVGTPTPCARPAIAARTFVVRGSGRKGVRVFGQYTAAEPTPGQLLRFQRLDLTAPPSPRADPRVTDPAAMDRFAAALSTTDAEILKLALKVTPPPTDRILLSFVVPGCEANRAALSYRDDHLSAVAYNNLASPHASPCPTPQYYAAVFAVTQEEWTMIETGKHCRPDSATPCFW